MLTSYSLYVENKQCFIGFVGFGIKVAKLYFKI